MSRSLRGAAYPLRGLVFLWRHPRLVPWAAIPFLSNLVAAGVLLQALLAARRHGLLGLPPPGPGWLMTLLYGLALVIAGLLTLLAAAALLAAVANPIASPWNAALSEQAELMRHDVVDAEGFSLRAPLKDAARSLRGELRRLGPFLLLQACLLLVYLVPAVGSVAGPILHLVVGGAATLAYLAMAYVDLPMSRCGLDLRRKGRFAWQCRQELVGFAAASALCLLLPGINLVTVPISVVGGTLLFLDLLPVEDRQGLRPVVDCGVSKP